MKVILCMVTILFIFVAPTTTQSQSLKKFEKKAKKTLKKEAYGMTLYYSLAILKINGDHHDALQWAKLSSTKLQLDKKPAYFFSKPPVAANQPIPLPIIAEKEVDSISFQPSTLVVQTFNTLDSLALNGTYIGLTNDGFGKGKFVQNNESENTAFFEIPKGQFFTVTGTKNSFLASSSTISATDNLNSDTLYRKLYLSPSWGLPLTLYFDHQKPEAVQPSDTLTNLTYEQTWIDFLYRIDDYIEGNTTDTTLISKAQAQSDIGQFFANHVDANFHQLESLCELLEHYLKTGKKITLNIEGYASPSELKGKNEGLIKRRLNSVENYFSFYKYGVFKQYQTNGQLTIKRHFSVKGNKKENIDVNEQTYSSYHPKNAKMQKVVVSLGYFF